MVPFPPMYRRHSGFISRSYAVLLASMRMCTFGMLGSILALIYAAGTFVVIRYLPPLVDIAATVNIAAVDAVGQLTVS